MTSPDEFHDLEHQLTRVLRAHGDSVEPSPDAYARLVQAVDEAPARFRRIRGLLAPRPSGGGPLGVSGETLRPLVFLAAVLAVAGVGGYSLISLASSPSDTATAAPATADVSDLVPRDESALDGDESSVDADAADDAGTAENDLLADNAENTPRSSVPSSSTATGTASATASDPAEEYAGLTYAPVRISRLEAADAFLDVLALDGLELEERNDRVIVRSTPASASGSSQAAVLTTLTIAAIGDGFTVVEATSDQLEVSIDNPALDDPTSDDIADDTVVAAPLELSGTITDAAWDITLALRSAVDGSMLLRAVPVSDPAGAGSGYRSTLSVNGAERVWVVATASGPDDDVVRALAARPVLYTGRADPASYTVVGLPPDDPDGGLIVRAAPGGEEIGVIELGSTGVRRRPVPPRLVDGTIWWAVTDPTGLDGWAAARYLAVDESPAETTMVELARQVIAAVTDGDLSAVDGIGLSRPVFVGSIVDPRPISGLADVGTLLTTRRRLANGTAGGPAVVADYYGFDRWSDAEVFVPKGYRQDGAAERARAFFGDLPSVVIRSLDADTGQWERVHLFVSRDGDRPTLVGMVLETEPPTTSPEDQDESATPPPPGADG